MQRAFWAFFHLGGTTIRILAGGPDEEQAVDELVKLVESGFAE